MKTSRIATGTYTVTGYTASGDLVQYEVTHNGHGWSVDLVYGKGATLDRLYTTKTEALKAILNQG